jgi:hypothetical protein
VPAPPPKPVKPAPPVAAVPIKPASKGPAGKATSRKGGNHQPKRKPAYADIPPMPAERILELTPGQSVFVRRLGRSAQVLLVKAERKKVVVDLGIMDAEIAFEDICAHSPIASGKKRSVSRKRTPPRRRNRRDGSAPADSVPPDAARESDSGDAA